MITNISYIHIQSSFGFSLVRSNGSHIHCDRWVCQSISNFVFIIVYLSEEVFGIFHLKKGQKRKLSTDENYDYYRVSKILKESISAFMGST